MERPKKAVTITTFLPFICMAILVYMFINNIVNPALFWIVAITGTLAALPSFIASQRFGAYYRTIGKLRPHLIEEIEATEDWDRSCPKCGNTLYHLEEPYQNWEYYCEHCHALVIPKEAILDPYIDPSEYMVELPKFPKRGQPKLFVWVFEDEDEEGMEEGSHLESESSA